MSHKTSNPEIQVPYYGITPSGIKCRTCGSLTTVIDGDIMSSNEHAAECGKQEAQQRADYQKREQWRIVEGTA